MAAKKVTEKKPAAKSTKTAEKKTASTKRTSKTKIVDTTAVEIPVENVEESKIEVEVNANPDQEIMDEIINRFHRYPISDSQTGAAAKIYEEVKSSLKDSYSEENGALIASAAADAALMAMVSIQNDMDRKAKIEEVVKLREQRKAERMALRKERKEARLTRAENRSEARAARKERLGLTNV